MTLRKIKQTAQVILAFAGGLTGGPLLAYEMETWVHQDGLPGGEALILPPDYPVDMLGLTVRRDLA